MHATSELILNFVLNACWQIAAIFGLTFVAAWLLKNGPARYRHILWVVALAACLVVPLLTATRFVPPLVSSVQVVAPTSVPTAELTPNDDFTVEHLVTRRTKPISTSTSIALLLTLAYAFVVFVRAITLARFWRRKETL